MTLFEKFGLGLAIAESVFLITVLFHSGIVE